MIPNMVTSPLISGDEWSDCYDESFRNSIIEESDDEPLFPGEEQEQQELQDEVDGGERYRPRGRARTNSSSLSSTSSPPVVAQQQEVVEITCGSRPRINKRKTSRRSKKRSGGGRGAVAKTLLGPAGALLGGRQEWSKMKKYVRRLAAAQDPTSLPVHNSELL